MTNVYSKITYAWQSSVFDEYEQFCNFVAQNIQMVAFKLAFKIVWFLHVSFLKNYAFFTRWL